MEKRFSPTTKSGHSLYDVISLLQKAIRRGEFTYAGYAAKELYPTYRKYMWKRLLIISAEDCDGIITSEILALFHADEVVSKNLSKGEGGGIFVAKAITLLCKALKNRDACYFACNFMLEDSVLDPSAIEHVSDEEIEKTTCTFPDWVYDVHTYTGKRRGKDIIDMIVSEQKGLYPKNAGLFDESDWGEFLQSKDAVISEKHKGVKRIDWSEDSCNSTPIKPAEKELEIW